MDRQAQDAIRRFDRGSVDVAGMRTIIDALQKYDEEAHHALSSKLKRMNDVRDMIARWNPLGKLEIKSYVLHEFYQDCSDKFLPMDELTYINGLIEGVKIGIGNRCAHQWGVFEEKCIYCDHKATGGAWRDM